MSQPPKTDLARELWLTCPICYGHLDNEHDGALKCPQGHYEAGHVEKFPEGNQYEGRETFPDHQTGQSGEKAADKLVADGGGGDCGVDGCDGTYRLDSIVDQGGTGHRRLRSTCEHTLIQCEFCREARPAAEIVFSLRPGVTPPAGKSVLCDRCAKGCRVYSFAGWGE